MYLTLGDVSIELISEDTRICDDWRKQFGDFLHVTAPSADIRLVARLVEQLPPLPTAKPYFVDQRRDAQGTPASILQAFHAKNGLTLHFFGGALIEIPLYSADIPTINAWLTTDKLDNGLIEDVTFVSLQPLLRRLGCFFIHASGASLGGEAVLFVGGSGSGKTTTCLNLVLNGWQMVANDVVMVKQHADAVYAYPVPDNVTIRPKTRALLPQLHPFTTETVDEQSFPAQLLVQENWSQPARISTLCFPQVTNQTTTSTAPHMQAIALAIMMQESIDRWDAAALQPHTNILDAICQQAACYTLILGSDLQAQRETIQAFLT